MRSIDVPLPLCGLALFIQPCLCRYLRDILMGVNDGLVSMFLLILGVRSVVAASSFTDFRFFYVLLSIDRHL